MLIVQHFLHLSSYGVLLSMLHKGVLQFILVTLKSIKQDSCDSCLQPSLNLILYSFKSIIDSCKYLFIDCELCYLLKS